MCEEHFRTKPKLGLSQKTCLVDLIAESLLNMQGVGGRSVSSASEL